MGPFHHIGADLNRCLQIQPLHPRNTYVELDYFLSQKEDELNLEEGEEPDFKHLTCGTL